MTREKIVEMVYNLPTIDNMWTVSVVWLDATGEIESTYCYFYDRYYAEKWLSEFVADGRPHYARCCGYVYQNKVEKLFN